MLAQVTGIGAAAESIAAATEAAGPPLRRDDFSPLRRLVTELLRAQAGLAAGAGIVLAPGTLADAPRCIEWWWTDPQAQISKLHVDLNPESAEFYDYTTTEWYREPERTGQPSVAWPVRRLHLHPGIHLHPGGADPVRRAVHRRRRG